MDKSQAKKVTGITVPPDLSAEYRPIGEEVHRLHESVLWSAQMRIPRVFVHPFRLNLYTRSGVFVHPGRS